MTEGNPLQDFDKPEPDSQHGLSTGDLSPPPDATEPEIEGQKKLEGDAVGGRMALVIIGLMILLADFTVYHAEGFSGPAVFIAGAVFLLIVGIPQRSLSPLSIALIVMLAILSCRLACNGTGSMLFASLWLVHALVLALRCTVPYVLETFVFAAQTIPGGYEFLSALNRQLRERVLKPVDEGKSARFLNIAMPVFSAALFAGIFVMANPDIVGWMSGRLSTVAESIMEFVKQFSPFEIAFWAVVAWLTGGLLRPVVQSFAANAPERDDAGWGSEQAPMYDAFRNTLLTVICLYAGYLVFEFQTLWFRSFPEGFHYSGYAHQGAAWLTMALALATLMLSLIFRGLTLCDPRLPVVKNLAWVWCGLNFVLATAVYHRLLIYIDFNGMTRMRVIGLLGTTSVVCGFALVMVKIGRQRNFLWLIRRQVWVVAFAFFVFVTLPVDRLIHRYNVKQILAGHLAPIVQVTEHSVDNEALLVLLPLCRLEDERFRSGMQAMLTVRLLQLRHESVRAERLGWTAWQKSRADALYALTAAEEEWTTFESAEQREAAWRGLKDHAFERWW